MKIHAVDMLKLDFMLYVMTKSSKLKHLRSRIMTK